jgi:polar amino acid transport system substrate-binding protein
MNGDVDVVASLITVTCERAREVAFSSEYYRANQGVMVRSDSLVASTSDLAGKRVCATRGSTSLANLEAQAPEAVPVPVEARTDCLVALQQGTVDAITADDTILVSFRAQDPKTRIVADVDLSDEPYAIAVNRDHPEFVRFVNGVLEALRATGRLDQLYREALQGVSGSRPILLEPRYAD